ncbi:scarecrow-like protein 32 isoform X2 [Hibiscus syriacus]|uniref:scarecrow-like protein 32 isoform X2 n=1 Tax=Hibiscus syriacus TaxID=106335 RepID=UPI001922711C|nr:scarecrow-like protein 32 isoform X2 [Hibiscus syriacus]
MEQLLVRCANAIESNDATLAQQILWVLINIAPPDGDSKQRLTCAFLRALIVRVAKSGTCKMLAAMSNARCNLSMTIHTHTFSIIELANYVDLTSWHRFGFTAANAAILEAVKGYSVVHIVDISSTHCMQIPRLIDTIANRLEGPPMVNLTVPGDSKQLPAMVDLTYEELGSKLVNFAWSRNVMLEFRVFPSAHADGFASLIDQLRLLHLVYAETGEALDLDINCHMMLHYIPEETLSPLPNANSIPYTFQLSSNQSMFLKALRGLNPTMVVLIEKDADLTSNNVVCRLKSALNYLWIPYDTVYMFLPKGSKQRQWYEAYISWKIENVVANKGLQRRWVQRMRKAEFRGVGFREEGISEVRRILMNMQLDGD